MAEPYHDKRRHILVSEGVIMGSMSRSLDKRSRAFTQWLCQQVPRDGTGENRATVMDVLMAIADDAFNEDIEHAT
jgi:hypothetical protein